MPKQTVRRIIIVFVIAIVSATIACAQSSASPETLGSSAYDNWQIAQQVGSSKSKLIVVTLDQPNRRQTCHVKSFTQDKLVCSRAIGGRRTYLPQQIAALILPGDDDYKRRFLLWVNGAMGAAIWGTVVLAGPCPGCAVGTGIVALGLFLAAGAVCIGDDSPDSLLYMASGQQLSSKLGYVKS
jgi:hypothetical protein